jgi:hypothetical protein
MGRSMPRRLCYHLARLGPGAASTMAETIRIATVGDLRGDDPSRLGRVLELGRADYVILGFLDELAPSLLQKQRSRDPRSGYARDFVREVEAALPLLRGRGVRIVTDAGGVNPPACRGALLEMLQLHGAALEVAAVVGDDLMQRLGELNATGVPLDHTGSGASFAAIRERVSSANARFGAWPAVAALRGGAQIVVTGRTTGSAPALASMIHAFGWAPDDWDRLAAGVVGGRILAAGDFNEGIDAPGLESGGVPVLEVSADGSFVVTTPGGAGGPVTVQTVKEHLVHRMGDPRAHGTPDVVADLASACLESAGAGRVRVRGVRGRPAQAHLDVSVAYFDGWKASSSILVSSPGALERARSLAGRFWAELGLSFAATRTELVGHSACWGALAPPSDPPELLLRLSVRDADRTKVERFARLLSGAALAGSRDVALAGGEPHAHEVVARWPARTPRERVKPTLVTRDGECELDWPTPILPSRRPRALPPVKWPPARGSRKHVKATLAALARARSGERGDTLEIGVLARAPEVYPWLERTLTAQVVKRHFEDLCRGRVERHAVPGLGTLGFLLHETLDGGGAVSLRLDAQGRTLAPALLALEVRVPRALLDAAARGDATDGRSLRRSKDVSPTPPK